MRARSVPAGVLAAVLLAPVPARADEAPAPSLHVNPFEKPAELLAPPPAEPTAPAGALPPPWTPELRAVMVAGRESMANVDGQLVAIGEEIEGHRLVEVTDRRAVFERDGVLTELVLE